MPLVSLRQVLDEAAKVGTELARSTSTTWSRFKRSWRRPARPSRRSSFRPAGRSRLLAGPVFVSPDAGGHELYPEIPTVLHLDHGNSPETCLSAIEMASPAS